MKLIKVALIGASIALFGGASVAQEAGLAPAPAAPQSQEAAATEAADPVVCRTEGARTTSRLKRRGDRRCLRRSEWETLRLAAEDRAVAAQQQQGGGRN